MFRQTAIKSRPAIEELRIKLPSLGLAPVNDRRIRAALEAKLPAAPDHLKAATGELELARKSFSNFEFEGAVERLKSAQANATMALATPGRSEASLKLLSEVHLTWGRVLEADGKSDAVEQFRCAARLDPKRTELDPGAFKPSVARLYKLARKTATKGTSVIVVRVRPGDSPSGATTQLDGRNIGTLPVTAEAIPSGIHYLVTRADNATTDAQVVTLAAKQTITVSLNRQTDNDRLVSARRSLASNPRKLDAASAQTIAELANAAVVVVVRSGNDGPMAATFQRNREKPPAWVPAAALTFQANREVSRPVSSSSGDGSVDGSDIAIGARTPNEDAKPWYLTWKGAAALGAVVAVATVAAIVLIPNGTSFEIGGPCTTPECSN